MDKDGRPGGISRVRRVVERVRQGRVATPEAAARLGTDTALLVESPLFDEDWYRALTGVEGDRLELVRHYLRTPLNKRVSPNRLFDRGFFAANYHTELDGKDVFLVYLRREAYRVPTHPLFDTRRYRRRNPAAANHEHGPIAHYQEVGAQTGLSPNSWLVGGARENQQSLLDWIAARRSEWRSRTTGSTRATVTRDYVRRGERALQVYADKAPRLPTSGPLVSVIVRPGNHVGHAETALRSLAEQTLRPGLTGTPGSGWEALVLDDGRQPELADLVARVLPAGSFELIPATGHQAEDLNVALDRSRGEWITILSGADTWTPDRLRLLSVVGQTEGHLVMADVQRKVRRDESSLLIGNGVPRGPVVDRTSVDLARLFISRELVSAVGPLNTSLLGAWDFEWVTRIAPRAAIHPIPFLGGDRSMAKRLQARHLPAGERPAFDHTVVRSWADVVLNEALIDFEALAAREQQAGLVSVIIPTYADWAMTVAAVESVMEEPAGGSPAVGHEVEVVVVDNGCDADASVILDSLAWRFPGVRVVHNAVNHGFALGNNLALPEARGEYVVFLNNDTTVDPLWLSPLVAALQDPEVLGAQSLLTYPSGVIQSAGIAFPTTGGVPHAFLQGFPIEDAQGVEELSFGALTGAALAMRFHDAVAMRGFDPVFRNGMEDIDLCLRLGRSRPGRFVVCPDSKVVHHESQTPGRYDAFDTNRELYLQRWGRCAPRDDAALWATRGFQVVDHAVAYRRRNQRRLAIPEPVLIRKTWLSVQESPPQLRWAIKNPAPSGPDAERWGDTHFARALAKALRGHGQEVVIDHQPEHERYTGRFDDVVLVLRGLEPYRPSFEHVTIGWVISHPEQLSTAEAVSYDRLIGASETWSKRRSRDWGIHIEPMLQATDHEFFHPDVGVPDTGHPVIFVGGSRREYRPIVRDAVEVGLPISIYGSQWRQFVPGRLVKSIYLPNAELACAYRSAGVVLNDHWEDMRVEGFISNRLFDAAAAGARVITDEVSGMGDIFGRSVQVYREASDLVRMSSSYDPDELFGTDEERRAVAARIHREHSFAARAERLIAIALDARRERGFA